MDQKKEFQTQTKFGLQNSVWKIPKKYLRVIVVDAKSFVQNNKRTNRSYIIFNT